jgi:hypothetical protein
MRFIVKNIRKVYGNNKGMTKILTTALAGEIFFFARFLLGALALLNI